jgi:hypothetical protein
MAVVLSRGGSVQVRYGVRPWATKHDRRRPRDGRGMGSGNPVAFQVLLELSLASAVKAFTPTWTDEDELRAAYEPHNTHVYASVAPDRLVDSQAHEGWGPLCAALEEISGLGGNPAFGVRWGRGVRGSRPEGHIH